MRRIHGPARVILAVWVIWLIAGCENLLWLLPLPDLNHLGSAPVTPATHGAFLSATRVAFAVSAARILRILLRCGMIAREEQEIVRSLIRAPIVSGSGSSPSAQPKAR